VRIRRTKPIDKKAARAATFGLIEQLKHDHPGESEGQLFKRYEERLAADPVLREAAIVGAFHMLCDELLDDFVREGKEVPPGLRKPH
jgi:hypothetical protein